MYIYNILLWLLCSNKYMYTIIYINTHLYNILYTYECGVWLWLVYWVIYILYHFVWLFYMSRWNTCSVSQCFSWFTVKSSPRFTFDESFWSALASLNETIDHYRHLPGSYTKNLCWDVSFRVSSRAACPWKVSGHDGFEDDGTGYLRPVPGRLSADDQSRDHFCIQGYSKRM